MSGNEGLVERRQQPKRKHPVCLIRWDKFFGWSDFKNVKFYRALFSEFLCVFILLYYNCCMSIQDDKLTDAAVLRISLTAGLLVASLVWGFAAVSGAHFNPAVTFGFFIVRRTNLIRSLLYICVQMLASVVAVYASRATIINDTKTPGFVQPDSRLSTVKASIMEFTITFLLLYVIMACVDRGREDLEGSRPLTIGLTVAVNCLVFVPLSGGSMNPIRCFGPAIVKNDMRHQWVYWTFSMLGGAIGALVYDQLMSTNASYPRFVKFLTDPDYNPDRKFYKRHLYHQPDIEEYEDQENQKLRDENEYYLYDENNIQMESRTQTSDNDSKKQSRIEILEDLGEY